MSEGSPTVTWRIVRLEETYASDVTAPPRPAARAVPAFEASSHRDRTEPPPGADHRRDRLGRARGAGAGDSPQQAQERSRAAAASSCAHRRTGVPSLAVPHVPRAGGPDPVLRARAISLRFDGNRVESG